MSNTSESTSCVGDICELKHRQIVATFCRRGPAATSYTGSMSAAEWLLLLAAGLAGGVINSVSSGGSFFTYPALLATGLPSIEAAATTLAALTPGNLAAVPEYLPEVKAQKDKYRRELPLVVAGATLGIILLLSTSADSFDSVVPWLILTATLLFAASPYLQRWAQASSPSLTDGAAGAAIVFVMSVYLTYFGSGVGNMMLAILLVRGFGDFFHANAAKNIVMTIGTVMAMVAYGFAGLIAWWPLIPVFIGSGIGAMFGAKAARRIPIPLLRAFVICLGLFVAAYQFLN